MRNNVYLAAIPALLVLLVSVQINGRTGSSPPDDKNARVRLTIELTGGDANKPIDQASVYVKFPTNPKDLKSKLVELNLKTNQQGTARSPEIPQGKVLIQIIAPGWKTFGEWYDINQEQQTIQIHLDRPSRKFY